MISARSVDAATTILDLHGPLTSGQEGAGLRQAVRLAFDGGARIVILNLQHVPGVDSSGVAALASAHMTAINHGGHVKLCNLTRKLKDIFAIMRLDAVFDSYETESDATASANAQT
jgi:anti-sigma B factor antagonist